MTNQKGRQRKERKKEELALPEILTLLEKHVEFRWGERSAPSRGGGGTKGKNVDLDQWK